MAGPRIDVVDPSPEAEVLVAALRTRGFEVAVRSVASLADGCDASLLLLAGDAPGAIAALEDLRADDTKLPVILLGRPAEDEGPEVTSVRRFDADAYYPRPVPIDRLVRKVETYLSPPETHLAPVSPLDRGPGHDGAGDDEAARHPAPTDPPAGGADSRRPPRTEIVPQEPEGREGREDLEHPEYSDVVTGPGLSGMKPRERTITLGDRAGADDDADGYFDDDFGAGDLSDFSEVTGVSFKDDILSIEEAAARHDADDPVSQVARRDDLAREPVRPTTESSAVLSPRLTKIFREADHRVFPDSPALDLDLPDHQESARELVPDALLEVVSFPTEAREEDPLEAFTYVGAAPEHVGAPLPMPEAAQRYQRTGKTADPAVSPPRPARTEAGALTGHGGPLHTDTGLAGDSRPARTFLQPEPTQHAVAEAETDDAADGGSGERTEDHFVAGDLDQVGVASEEEVLRILLSVASGKGAVDAHFERPDGSIVELSVAQGRLTRLSGRVHARAVEDLFRQGRIDEVPVEESRAAAVLDGRVASGLLGRFEADRLLRRIREAEIHELLAEATLSYSVTAASALRGADPGLLSAPLAMVITEGARRRISATRFRQLMGGGALVIEVRRDFGLGAERLGIEPEVAGVIERHDGASLDEVLREVSGEEGLAGALYALWAIGVVGVTAGEPDRTGALDPAESNRALIEAAYRLAEDGSYFDVLGVSPEAMVRELRAAYVAKRRELRDIDLDAHALAGLAAERRDALQVVEEAWQVLRDDGVRAAYRRALGL